MDNETRLALADRVQKQVQSKSMQHQLNRTREEIEQELCSPSEETFNPDFHNSIALFLKN
jgi:hypothetical protein